LERSAEAGGKPPAGPAPRDLLFQLLYSPLRAALAYAYLMAERHGWFGTTSLQQILNRAASAGAIRGDTAATLAFRARLQPQLASGQGGAQQADGPTWWSNALRLGDGVWRSWKQVVNRTDLVKRQTAQISQLWGRLLERQQKGDQRQVEQLQGQLKSA